MSIYYYFDDKYHFRRLMRRYKEMLHQVKQLAASEYRLKEEKHEETMSFIGLWTEQKIEAKCKQKLKELSESYDFRPILALKAELDGYMRTRRDELLPYLEEAFKSESTNTIQNDLQMYKKELAEVHEFLRSNDLVSYYQNAYKDELRKKYEDFLETIRGENSRFLNDVIVEINDELERRKNVDPTMKRLMDENEMLRLANSQIQKANVELEKANAELEEELNARLASESSKYEKLAEKLLQKAQSISGAEARIREQWRAEGERQPADRRRDIDRIYQTILEQFRETL